MRKVGEHKAKKGLIRFEIEEENGIAKRVKISGDFFIYPEESIVELERKLTGKETSKLEEILDEFFKVSFEGEMPYVTVEDFKMALKNALRG
ncbi:lipoate--protein ligase family protein [Thermococci archaeon]|uniref:lipoate protein ligase C-terminal domain-containing protein n=1 Tax=Palaeococcus sp. (in: euryarchaeotes) TaxID=2820298 RepID=UPI000F0EDF60|nr:lipoate protein ligase C-terminal domain-containing protein [Palaeococcus sp. (in: euryarchaeotes)]MCD6558880.1 lipoate--protein ligase family protein [Palaeococcus sp. (in: euryarchaeotes)]RLF74830.1 MAG: lipoate--protein ligase family protein [Thermococci archaeon]RLF89261.1 MAG: lipoate--protein ligase family protein [Thermococci archaeon]